MLGPKPIKDRTYWAVVDYEGNIVGGLHYNESQADSAAFQAMRENKFLSDRVRTCEVVVREVR